MDRSMLLSLYLHIYNYLLVSEIRDATFWNSASMDSFLYWWKSWEVCVDARQSQEKTSRSIGRQLVHYPTYVKRKSQSKYSLGRDITIRFGDIQILLDVNHVMGRINQIHFETEIGLPNDKEQEG